MEQGGAGGAEEGETEEEPGGVVADVAAVEAAEGRGERLRAGGDALAYGGGQAAQVERERGQG